MRVYEFKLQRTFLKEIPSESKVTNSRAAYDYLKDNCFKTDEMYREYSFLVFLNKSNEVIGHSLLSIGGTECTPIDIKLAAKLSIMSMASSVILAHNHPSNNPTPSKSDIEQTRKLKSALSAFDISLIDHIIIADGSYFSFAEERTYKN